MSAPYVVAGPLPAPKLVSLGDAESRRRYTWSRKVDGLRFLLDSRHARAWTKAGGVASDPRLGPWIRALPPETVVDGDLCWFGPDDLESASRVREVRADPGGLRFVVHDVLRYRGSHTWVQPFTERYEVAGRVVQESRGSVAIERTIAGAADFLFTLAGARGWEGIVGKPEADYRAGGWLKVKTR